MSKTVKRTFTDYKIEEHVATKINREILEDVNGNKSTKEVETSISQKYARKQKETLYEKEKIKNVINHLNSDDPAKLLQFSKYGRNMLQSIIENKNDFYNKYPNYKICENLAIDEEALNEYDCAPFVDFTFNDILNIKTIFTTKIFEHLIIGKLIWSTISSIHTNELESSIMLKTINVNNHSACVTFKHKGEKKILEANIILHNIDPFLLMLIPDKQSHAQVKQTTLCIANETLDALNDL